MSLPPEFGFVTLKGSVARTHHESGLPDDFSHLDLPENASRSHRNYGSRKRKAPPPNSSFPDDDPFITKLQVLLGIENTATGSIRSTTGDVKHLKVLAKRRSNRYKQTIVRCVKQKLDNMALSEAELIEVLGWQQSRHVFPILHAALDPGAKENDQALETGVKELFQNIGKSAKKAAVALITKNLPIAQALRLTGEKRKYVTSAKSPTYNPLMSRLCSEDYTPAVKRRKIVDLEKEALIEHMSEDRLHDKSGNRLSGRRYRHAPFTAMYHEDYQDCFHDVMKRIVKKLDECPAKEVETALKNQRFNRNLITFRAHGEKAVVWKPSKVQRTREADDEGNESAKMKNTNKLLPLCESAFKRCIRYNRSTKQGIRMTRVSTRQCEPCRELPRAKRRRTKIDILLAAKRSQRPAVDCTAEEKELAKLERRLLTLERHARWNRHNNAYIKKVEDSIAWGDPGMDGTVMSTLDFGKFYFSDGSKAKSLVVANSSSGVVPGEISLEYIDNWFRGGSNGVAAVRVLEYLLARTTVFQDAKRLIFSGDTGNGFRGFELYHFYSTCWSRFGKIIEVMHRCPRHAENWCDRHIAHVVTKSAAIRDSAGLFELVEYANISTEIINTQAFVHDAGIDNVDTKFVDEKVHKPIKNISRPPGLRKITHAQFRWKLPDGSWYSKDGVCRVQEMINGGPEKRSEWNVWCLDTTQPKLCQPCSNAAQRAIQHISPDQVCPLEAKIHKHVAAPGIEVRCCAGVLFVFIQYQ